MRTITRAALAIAVPALGLGVGAAPAVADDALGVSTPADPETVRVATYRVDLVRDRPGELAADLAAGDEQAATVAQVLQTVRPDVVVLNGFDLGDGGAALETFREDYLAVSTHGEDPLTYEFAYTGPLNAGRPSGRDLDGDGSLGGRGDAYGGGIFPGQAGTVLLSNHPIETDEVRTFAEFYWADMPGARIEDRLLEAGGVRLHSTGAWDVPLEVDGARLHVLVAGTTAGPAQPDRTLDEIRFWADYVTAGRVSSYVYDDDDVRGGLRPGSRFVLAGHLGADPVDGPVAADGVRYLIDRWLVRDPRPRSAGAVEAAVLQRGENLDHDGPAERDTADLADATAGNLRLDYVLPSRLLETRGSGVFWPAAHQPGSELTGIDPFPASAHRPVWVDVVPPDAR